MIDVRALDSRTQLIALSGHADVAASGAVQREILRGLRAGRTRTVLDMSAVEQVAPGVLGSLLRMRRHLLAVGGGLAVVCDRPAAELFDVRLPDNVLARALTVDEAVGMLA